MVTKKKLTTPLKIMKEAHAELIEAIELLRLAHWDEAVALANKARKRLDNIDL